MRGLSIAAALGVALIGAHGPASAAGVEVNSSPAFVSELIPIRYALASDVSGVLSASNAGGESNNADRWMAYLPATVDKTSLRAEIDALGKREITCEERSNSLLVLASRSDLATIKNIIGRMDRPLAQILVEAIVLEFHVDGPRWSDRPQIWTEQNPPPSFRALTNLTTLSALQFNSFLVTNANDRVETQVRYSALLEGDFESLITALASRNKVKILQRPRIQTSSGVPATLFAGHSASSSAGFSGAAYSCGCPAFRNPSQVGVTIEVNCFLTEDGKLLTDIKQAIDLFLGNVNIQNVGDVRLTASTMFSQHVAIHDRETIALGGVMDTVKVPIFSEVASLNHLPIAGHFLNRLVTYPTRNLRYELLVLIRPVILPVPEAHGPTTER